MQITVIGLGYVGLSIAVLLAQKHTVLGVDISQERVDIVNQRRSPIKDNELTHYLETTQLSLTATTDLQSSIKGSHYIIIAVPTNYDESQKVFDTTTAETIIAKVSEQNPNACIVVKSTVPVGFIDKIRERLNKEDIFFSPEFLREGMALHDNLHPSRIVIGSHSDMAKTFAHVLTESAIKEEIDVLFTGAKEAEAIKLFSNTYLAMRIAYFNELDSYTLDNELNTQELIEGVCLDPRIGNHYNNPSFGYGGYCLPKDTKQLLSNYNRTPQKLIKATIESNILRIQFIIKKIVQLNPKRVGVYRLSMKESSDNFRESSVIKIIQEIQKKGFHLIIYDETITEPTFHGIPIEKELSKFTEQADLILANRVDHNLGHVRHKVFTRDIYNRD